MFFKIGVLKNFANFTGKHLCCSLFLITLKAWRPVQLHQRETPTQMFSCEICESFKNAFFYRTPPVAPSVTLDIYIPVKFFLISIDCWWMISCNLISTLFIWFPEPLFKGLIFVHILIRSDFQKIGQISFTSKWYLRPRQLKGSNKNQRINWYKKN